MSKYDHFGSLSRFDMGLIFGLTTILTSGLLRTIRADGRAMQRLELLGADWLLICEGRAFILISSPIHIKGLMLRNFA